MRPPLSLLLLLFMFSSLSHTAQKKKELKKQGIRSATVYTTEQGKTIVDSKSTYDSEGRLIMEINYDKLGKLKSTRIISYNASGEILEETMKGPDGKLEKRTTYK